MPRGVHNNKTTGQLQKIFKREGSPKRSRRQCSETEARTWKESREYAEVFANRSCTAGCLTVHCPADGELCRKDVAPSIILQIIRAVNYSRLSMKSILEFGRNTCTSSRSWVEVHRMRFVSYIS